MLCRYWNNALFFGKFNRKELRVILTLIVDLGLSIGLALGINIGSFPLNTPTEKTLLISKDKSLFFSQNLIDFYINF